MSATETTIVKCKTRVDENATEKTVTELTINWDGTDEQMRMFATRGVVIAAQSIMRSTGDIPDTLTVSVAELAKRERGGFAMKATPENALRLLGKLDVNAMTTALTQLGMGKSDIARILANRPKSTAPVVPTLPAPVVAKKVTVRK